eukprot:2831688-Amphidinium_carterae.2
MRQQLDPADALPAPQDGLRAVTHGYDEIKLQGGQTMPRAAQHAPASQGLTPRWPNCHFLTGQMLKGV